MIDSLFSSERSLATRHMSVFVPFFGPDGYCVSVQARIFFLKALRLSTMYLDE